MTSWQKHARRGLAAFFVAFAAFVYLSIRERPTLAPPADVPRLDPGTVSETIGADAVRLSGADRTYQIKGRRQVFEDGSTQYDDAEVTVEKSDGRTYVLTATRILVGPDQIEYEATGVVRLRSDDGFELVTTRALFTETEDIVRMPDDVTFTQRRMQGSGVGAAYDHTHDVLQVLSEAVVTMTDESGATTLNGTAGMATLDRVRDRLMLDGDVHVTRQGQRTRANQAVAQLSNEEDVVTALELRGDAHVEGGGGRIELMAARDIDLDYTDDGTSIEHAVLAVGAAIALRGADGSEGLRLAGEKLDLALASDGSILSAIGEAVEFGLPAEDGAPGRRIRADELDASGQEGRGLTAAVFRRDVAYREGAGPTPDRVASARELTLGLRDTEVERAEFAGAAQFESGGLTAAAERLRYDPRDNRLQLDGPDGFGDPRVTDEQKRVQARAIEVAIDTQGLTASGDVRTLLLTTSSGDAEADDRLPGLLDGDDPVSVYAAGLDYGGDTGRAVYSGQAALSQGDTEIRADEIVVDRRRGDLVATGAASARMALDGDVWEGEADEIRYDDAARVVTYSRAPAGPTNPGGVPIDPRPGPRRPVAHLSGGGRDLRAGRIDVVLADTGTGVARLEAHTDLAIVVDERWGHGARLTYDAAEGRYDLSGTPAAPAVFCDGSRESDGATLTFYESTDRIAVNGQTRRSSNRPCAPAP